MALKSQTNILKKHLWKERVVLFFSQNEENIAAKAQLSIFESDEQGMKERNLVVYQIYGTTGKNPQKTYLSAIEIAALHQYYQPQLDGFTVILVGKDGGEKLRKNSILALQDLFDTIDAMPMRQSEMKRKNN
jgi:hypothetical protein